jgi:hypothetical protein
MMSSIKEEESAVWQWEKKFDYPVAVTWLWHFISEDDLVILQEELESGKIHLSHEVCGCVCYVLDTTFLSWPSANILIYYNFLLQATVGAVAILSPSSWLYSAWPIVISGCHHQATVSCHFCFGFCILTPVRLVPLRTYRLKQLSRSIMW